MQIFLVGRVRIETVGNTIEEPRFGGRQGRLLFARLVAAQGGAVARDELADALWGVAPPPTWEKALTILVSKLRALLVEAGVDGARALTAEFGCYRLVLPEVCRVDLVVAARSARAAEQVVLAGDYPSARDAALVTESLTRSGFLPGEDGTWVTQQRRELTALRAAALGVLAETCLRTGVHTEAADWARQAIDLEPFREDGYRALMHAHVAAGNRAEALRVFDQCRRLLADELGTDPSPETVDLYRHVLDPPRPTRTSPPRATRPPARPAPRRTPRRRRRVIDAALVAALLAGVTTASTAGVATRGYTEARATVPPNSVVALNDDGSIAGTVPVGARPVAMSATATDLWVANLDDSTMTRVDLATLSTVGTVGVTAPPTAVTTTSDAVWITDDLGGYTKIDPSYNQQTEHRSSPIPSSFVRGTSPVLAAFHAVWIVDSDGYATPTDPASGDPLAPSVNVGNAPSSIAAASGSLWVTNAFDGTLTRIDPRTMLTTPLTVGHRPVGVAVAETGIWVADAGIDELVRIDPDTGTVQTHLDLHGVPTALLAADGILWVARKDGTVLQVDPTSNTIRKTIGLGGSPTALAAAGGRVWVSVAATPPAPPPSGGVARFSTSDEAQSTDPAFPSADGLIYATCANLVTYPDTSTPDGSRIVPEVAEAVPTPTNGGRTYIFTIAPGFRFSPPSKEVVTAATFKSTIERVAAPSLDSPMSTAFSNVDGYQDYVRGTTAGMSGVVAHGDMLTITLRRPDGGLLPLLAGGAACAVPVGTPAVRYLDTIPSAGPYYVAYYARGQELLLKRNPNYHGERPHQLAEIRIALGVDSAKALREIEANGLDYALDGLPPSAVASLATRYGPGSSAARAGHQQYFAAPANGIRMLVMNTSRPLFADVRLRRAVNFAIDRRALVDEGRRAPLSNPFSAGRPTDGFLTAVTSAVGASPHYPLDGPDVKTARNIAGRVHAHAVMYAPNTALAQQEAQIVHNNLGEIGIDVEVVPLSWGAYYDRLGRPTGWDLAINTMAFSTADPGEPVAMFDSASILPADNPNLSYLRDPNVDALIHAAEPLSGNERRRAYEQIEDYIVRDVAPAAAFGTTVSYDFFSARIGCQLYQPVRGLDLAALCLR